MNTLVTLPYCHISVYIPPRLLNTVYFVCVGAKRIKGIVQQREVLPLKNAHLQFFSQVALKYSKYHWWGGGQCSKYELINLSCVIFKKALHSNKISLERE